MKTTRANLISRLGLRLEAQPPHNLRPVDGKAEPYRTVRRLSRTMCISESLLFHIVQSSSSATHIVYRLCLPRNKSSPGTPLYPKNSWILRLPGTLVRTGTVVAESTP